jgi:hypothetical protein
MEPADWGLGTGGWGLEAGGGRGLGEPDREEARNRPVNAAASKTAVSSVIPNNGSLCFLLIFVDSLVHRQTDFYCQVA